GHDDNLAVADLAHVLDVVDVHANRRDEGRNLVVLQKLFELGLLDVEHLAAKGQDGLELPVAPALGAAAGRVALDEEELALVALATRAVVELARQPAAGQGVLALLERVAGLLRGDAQLRG